MDENEIEKPLTEEEKANKIEQMKEELYKGIQVICDKHGIVTNSSIYLRNTSLQKADDKENVVENHSFFCINCIQEYLTELTEQGKLAKVQLGVSGELLKKLNLTQEELEKYYTKATSSEPN
jgi:hypothetical protein